MRVGKIIQGSTSSLCKGPVPLRGHGVLKGLRPECAEHRIEGQWDTMSLGDGHTGDWFFSLRMGGTLEGLRQRGTRLVCPTEIKLLGRVTKGQEWTEHN